MSRSRRQFRIVFEDIGLDSIGLQEKLNAIRSEKIASTPEDQREKPSGKVTARFDHIFENNQSMLICSIKDGFCETKITSVLSESYRIATSERNFNSREEYMDYFWQIFGFSVLILTVILFIAIGLLVFGGLTIYGKVYNCQANKKQQKAEEDGTPSGTEFTEVKVVDVSSLESSESAQEVNIQEEDSSDSEVHGVEEKPIVKLADAEEKETDKLPDAS